jgi:hypothetical protein
MRIFSTPISYDKSIEDHWSPNLLCFIPFQQSLTLTSALFRQGKQRWNVTWAVPPPASRAWIGRPRERCQWCWASGWPKAPCGASGWKITSEKIETLWFHMGISWEMMWHGGFFWNRMIFFIWNDAIWWCLGRSFFGASWSYESSLGA